MLHYKSYGIAPLPLLKSLKIPLAGTTKNEGVFSLANGLSAFIVLAGFFKRHKITYHINNIEAVSDFFYRIA
jgi:hypothetical protein